VEGTGVVPDVLCTPTEALEAAIEELRRGQAGEGWRLPTPSPNMSAMFTMFTLRRRGRRAAGPRAARLRRPPVIVLSVLVEAIPLWRRGYGLGGSVVARCHDGHQFTTIWIPGASVKALRLGRWRFQRCPVGHHWSIVTPVRKADLSRGERRKADAVHDIRVP
jgi:hypothetical protein